VAGLKLVMMFVLCGNSALHTRVPNITVIAHQDHRMEVVTGKLTEQPVGAEVTKLKMPMSVKQIKSSMGLPGRSGMRSAKIGERRLKSD
jgi:hypothetical protein